MDAILVTGGTGTLGSAVVMTLLAAGRRVRLLSRKPAPPDRPENIEWVQGNITSGDGLAAALAGTSMVVNCTGDPRSPAETDVQGVGRLAREAAAAGVSHFLHVSITGIDRITGYPYYEHKRAAEAEVIGSGVPYSIQRLTQFHPLLSFLMTRLAEQDGMWMLPVAHDAQFQLLDTGDAANQLLAILDRPAAGLLPEVGGPQILRVEEIARAYLAARGILHPVFRDPAQDFFPPAAIEAFRKGLHTAPDRMIGRVTWADYLQRLTAG